MPAVNISTKLNVTKVDCNKVYSHITKTDNSNIFSVENVYNIIGMILNTIKNILHDVLIVQNVEDCEN